MFYNTNAREYTCKLLDAVDEGIISPRDALASALSYMSDSEVKDMWRDHGFFFLEEKEELDFSEEE